MKEDYPLISVITPTHDPAAPYLEEAYEGLLGQESAAWEWILQFDGESWELPSYLVGDPRITLECNGKHLGIAMTRNRALTRSRGQFIQTLDADDIFLPDALAATAEVLQRGGYAYALGWHADLFEDGRREKATLYLPLGEIPPGRVIEYWYQFSAPPYYGKMPFTMPCVMWRREILFAYGGWTAIEVGEDTDLLLAVAEDHTGFYLDRETMLYRRHGASTMHGGEYWDVQRPRDHAFMAQRPRAIRKLKGLPRRPGDTFKLRTGDPKLVSVITPAQDLATPHLKDAYKSLLAQGDDVEWEWVLQFDGADEDWVSPHWLGGDSRVRVECNGAHWGIAMTRNRALSRSRGLFIQTLDADDMLLPGALAAGVSGLADERLAYSVGRILHFVNSNPSLEDDSGCPRVKEIPFGEISAGAIPDYWDIHDNPPIAENAIMWRRPFLFAYGAWTALQVSEDSGLLVAVTMDHPGVYLDQYTLIYRQHETSTMHLPGFWDRDRPRAHKFVAERVKARRRLNAECLPLNRGSNGRAGDDAQAFRRGRNCPDARTPRART